MCRCFCIRKMRHEILNEVDRSKVYLDIYEWLTTKAIMPISGAEL